MKRWSAALLLVLTLAAVPALTIVTPPDCPPPLANAQDAGLPDPLLEETAPLPGPTPFDAAYMTYAGDVKATSVAPIGVEIVEPPGCPEISGE